MAGGCEVQQPPSWTGALRECDVIGSGYSLSSTKVLSTNHTHVPHEWGKVPSTREDEGVDVNWRVLGRKLGFSENFHRE
jgi:hypothetical protein